MTLTRINETEARLLQWRASYCERDAMIRYAATAAGLSAHRIALLMGLSRQTVARIIEGDPRALRQAPR